MEHVLISFPKVTSVKLLAPKEHVLKSYLEVIDVNPFVLVETHTKIILWGEKYDVAFWMYCTCHILSFSGTCPNIMQTSAWYHDMKIKYFYHSPHVSTCHLGSFPCLYYQVSPIYHTLTWKRKCLFSMPCTIFLWYASLVFHIPYFYNSLVCISSMPFYKHSKPSPILDIWHSLMENLEDKYIYIV